jgi:hypothetical protein
MSSKEGGKRMTKARHVEYDTESCINLLPVCQQSARVGLFIMGGQGTYYNALNTPNYLPHQYSTRSGGNLVYYVKTSLCNAPMAS